MATTRKTRQPSINLDTILRDSGLYKAAGNLTQPQCKKLVHEALKEIIRRASEGPTVYIHEVGSFSLKLHKGRKQRSGLPTCPEMVEFPDSRLVRFKIAPSVKAAMNGKLKATPKTAAKKTAAKKSAKATSKKAAALAAPPAPSTPVVQPVAE